jgi:predicted MFS family arabinose efflux permease
MSLSPKTKAILICGSVILSISLGIRHSFGLFLQPISLELGWGREVFGLAIAIQNLVWGIAQPFAGIQADRRGAAPVILVGGVLFATGVFLMTVAGTALLFQLAAGVLVGLGLAGTTMPIVFGAISRAMPPEKRSLAFGVAMSIGSIGQFALLPSSLFMINGLGWTTALLILSLLGSLIVPLSFAIKQNAVAGATVSGPSAKEAARHALRDRGFLMLCLGFFVCGFQVVFIATHMPAYLVDAGMSASLGSTVLALIGLFNIFGSLAAGYLGGKFSKPKLLTGIYLGRAVAISVFIAVPITALSASVFAAVMGLLWLSTVPLTNAAVATMFGVKNMSLLGGIVFLAHQIGSFLGGWLGGVIFDQLGSYDLAWTFAIALSMVAAAANWPIKDAPVKIVATA